VIIIIKSIDDSHVVPYRAVLALCNKSTPMSVIILLLIASISIAGLFLFAFIWSVSNGQMDDDYSPPRRILFDQPGPTDKKTS
jgi:cbb3-type cytochrome oxidase maturation protein